MIFLQKIKQTTRKVNPEMQATWSTKYKTKTKQNTQHKKKKDKKHEHQKPWDSKHVPV